MKRALIAITVIGMAVIISGCPKDGTDSGTDMGNMGFDSNVPLDGGTDMGTMMGGNGCTFNAGFVNPGGLGGCCQSDGECAAGLGCHNGYCTVLGCATSADCAGTVGPNDRAAFPAGTTFDCLTDTNAANAPAFYCAPVGTSIRVCAGSGDLDCDVGEVCDLGWDVINGGIGGVCQTEVIVPEPIASLGIGAPWSACYTSSNRSCLQDSECRPMIVADIDNNPATPDEQIEFCNTLTGFCELKAPFTDYQCSGVEGTAEFFALSDGSPLTGPGTGMEGGCHTNTFMGVATCTVYCNPTNPNCPAGMECAPWTFWGDDVGLCVQQQCFIDESPYTSDEDLMNPTPINAAMPGACTVDADCTNGGQFNARCVDLECEFTSSYVACPTGQVCSRATWYDGFDQGIDPMETERDELDTILLFCTPESLVEPGVTGAVGDLCQDDLDCVGGICAASFFLDPAVSECLGPCGTDADCPANMLCSNIGFFNETVMPLCLSEGFFESTICTTDADCTAPEVCQTVGGRSSFGMCGDRTGTLANTSPDAMAAGATFSDNAPMGAECFNDINRCTDGPDDVVDSTPADALAGTCQGDDVLVTGDDNCASGFCWDGNELEVDGDLTDGPRICSGTCRDNSDCPGTMYCGSLLFNDNSTDDTADDVWIGLCVNYASVDATDNCDAGSMGANDGLCGVLGGDSCDDGMGEATPPSFTCYTSGNLGAVGAPCVEDFDCGPRMFCLDEYGIPATAPVVFTGGYCVADGCTVDPVTGVGGSCGVGYDAGGGNTDTVCALIGGAVVGSCLKACTTDADCRNGGVDYSCQEAVPGQPSSMACLAL